MSICPACTQRLAGVSPSTIAASVLNASPSVDSPSHTCCICMGLLEAGTLRSAVRAAVDAVAAVDHEPGPFALEVSSPQASCLLREYCYVQARNKGGNVEGGTQGVTTDLRHVLKSLLAAEMERLWSPHAFDSDAPLRLALSFTYRNEQNELEFLKSAFGGGDVKRHEAGISKKRRLLLAEENRPCSVGTVQAALRSSKASTLAAQFGTPPPPPACDTSVEVTCYRSSIYISGRYNKLQRGLSQTPWIMNDVMMSTSSVEECLAPHITAALKGDGYKFISSGREDIDVRMLGNGRPFAIEVLNPRTEVPTSEVLQGVQKEINAADSGVTCRDIAVADEHLLNTIKNAGGDKQKAYRALIWCSRQLKAHDLEVLRRVSELKVLQNTPVRVLHRRSPLIREKYIHELTAEAVAGAPQCALIEMRTSAGTYIKEFVHGDLGRTQPNVGSILGCEAHILQLDVSDVIV